MRVLLPAFLALLLVTAGFPAVSGVGIDYSSMGSNDYGAYMYFSSLLDKFVGLYEIILDGNSSALNTSLELYSLTNSTYRALLIYSSVGVKNNVLSLARDFRTLGECSLYIANGSSSFNGDLSVRDYADARSDIFLMKKGLSLCNETLYRISSVPLAGGGNRTVRMNVSTLSAKLEDVSSLVVRFQRSLDALKFNKNFSVFVVPCRPVVDENVTLFGYAPNMSSVLVWVNGTTYRVMPENGTFHMSLSFHRPGVYEVYATGTNTSGTFRSAPLTVPVDRIPTTIVATETRNGTVVVSGHLLDVWGNGVPYAVLSMISPEGNYSVRTGEDGSFNLTLNVSSVMNTTLLFAGNNRYSPSNFTLMILPTKLRPVIHLLYHGGAVKAGDVIRITGSVTPSERIPLIVYVDGSKYTTINADGKFSFHVRLDEGTHEVYVYFPGNDELSPAGSNVLTITATPINYKMSILLLLSFMVLAWIGYRIISQKKDSTTVESNPSVEAPTPRSVQSFDAVASYRIVYRFLRRLYSLPISITPRELLSKLQNKPFYDELVELTELHEMALYARVRRGISGAVNAARKASRVIITAIVGDEL